MTDSKHAGLTLKLVRIQAVPYGPFNKNLPGMPRLNSGLVTLAFVPLAFLTGCDTSDTNGGSATGSGSKKQIAESIDKEEALEAIRLQPVTDPVVDKIEAYRKQMAEHFYAQKFDALEKEASALRTSKEIFGNGVMLTADNPRLGSTNYHLLTTNY